MNSPKSDLDDSLGDPGERFGFQLRHVGVAVPNLESAANLLSDLFGYKVVSGPFEDPIQKVAVNFMKQRGEDAAEIELIAPLSDKGPIQAILAKGSAAAYHLCFETSDIDGALEYLKSKGCLIMGTPVPAVAFGGRRIAWIYTPTRQLFELLEAESQENNLSNGFMQSGDLPKD
jgi:methylmalonyl-CoA/ethylmalonyl-CoA epimerase